MRGSWLLAGVGMLLLLAACGGGDKKDEAKDTGSAPESSLAPARPFPGEPAATAVTRRMDRIVSAVPMPAGMDVLSRRDVTNERTEQEAPEIGKRFKETGRQIGAYYIIGRPNEPLMQLSINQYSQPDGAQREFNTGKGNPAPADRFEAAGIGEQAQAARTRLGGPGGIAPIVISFTRGRYYVVIVDQAQMPDQSLALARAVDEQLKAHPAQ